MTLQQIPSQLLNTSGEHCFMSCMGMSLAHFGKLGNLTLKDIVAEIERPSEEYTPMPRAFAWMVKHGLQPTYVEKLDLSNKNNRDFIDEINGVGAIYQHKAPNVNMINHHLERGAAVLAAVTYSGEPNDEPDHMVYIIDADNYGTQILDPVEDLATLPNISWAWSSRPNLIVIEKH